MFLEAGRLALNPHASCNARSHCGGSRAKNGLPLDSILLDSHRGPIQQHLEEQFGLPVLKISPVSPILKAANSRGVGNSGVEPR